VKPRLANITFCNVYQLLRVPAAPMLWASLASLIRCLSAHLLEPESAASRALLTVESVVLLKTARLQAITGLFILTVVSLLFR
jgi:hypothetical protein